jgi:hypothetical protein
MRRLVWLLLPSRLGRTTDSEQVVPSPLLISIKSILIFLPYHDQQSMNEPPSHRPAGPREVALR